MAESREPQFLEGEAGFFYFNFRCPPEESPKKRWTLFSCPTPPLKEVIP